MKKEEDERAIKVFKGAASNPRFGLMDGIVEVKSFPCVIIHPHVPLFCFECK